MHRLFKTIKNGNYLEVGAYHPVIKSTTYAFYRKGWSGVLIEPQAALCALSLKLRPRDTIVQCAVSDTEVEDTSMYIIKGSARSTLSLDIIEQYAGSFITSHTTTKTLNSILDVIPWASGDDFHFMVIDVEGYEARALKGLNLQKFRPWVIVIEAIDPISLSNCSNEWSSIITDANYDFAFFDGVSNYYLAQERKELAPMLYPACSTDSYRTDFPDQPSIDQLIKEPAVSLNSREKEALSQLATPSPTQPSSTLSKSSINTFSELPIESLDKLEDFSLSLQMTLSRARLKKILDDTGQPPA